MLVLPLWSGIFKATRIVSNKFYPMIRKESVKGGEMVIISYIHKLDPCFIVCHSMLYVLESSLQVKIYFRSKPKL